MRAAKELCMKWRRCIAVSFVVDGSEGKAKIPQAMSITTKRGDRGVTDLLFGGKVSKGDPQIEALGAVDELNANLGIARVLLDGEIARAIDQIQEWLVTLMGELAMPFGKEIEYEKAGFGRISITEIQWLEDWSASIEKEEKFEGWLRPGERGGELSARIHLARTVARRAERRSWDVVDEVASAEVRIFLNRLSDALWLLASASEKL